VQSQCAYLFFVDDLHGMHVVALLRMCHEFFTCQFKEHVASVRHGRPGQRSGDQVSLCFCFCTVFVVLAVFDDLD